MPEDPNTTIAAIEKAIEDSDAIERLNAGVVDSRERVQLETQFEHLKKLRTEELEKLLVDIEKEVQNLEKDHSDRLRVYGINDL